MRKRLEKLMPKVTIVIPAYNARKFLADCLESVCAQSFKDWNLIVVDDGSVDNTAAIAQLHCEQDPRITLYTQENGGVANARNRGLALADPQTEYFLFLDQDDFLHADALETLLDVLEATASASAAYGLPQAVDERGQPLSDDVSQAFGYARLKVSGRGMMQVEEDAPTTFESLVIWPCIATPGQVLIRASSLRNIGEFDQAAAPSDDWDVWLRLSLEGDLLMLRRFVLGKRGHGENVSSKGKVMAVAEPVVRHKLAVSLPLTNEQRRIARVGHRCSCFVKLSWGEQEMKQRRWLSALKTVYRAGRSYLRYVRTIYVQA